MSTATKSKPILFSGPMVRAVLDGRKTMTRRIIKDIPKRDDLRPARIDSNGVLFVEMAGVCGHKALWPYGGASQLWVRETWQSTVNDSALACIAYRATPDIAYLQLHENGGEGDAVAIGKQTTPAAIGKWSTSMFMPRWASRITLEITDVRVERLGELTEADALAEGIKVCNPGTQFECYWDYRDNTSRSPAMFNARDSFCTLWESINGAWDESLWVWAISFRRITP